MTDRDLRQPSAWRGRLDLLATVVMVAAAVAVLWTQLSQRPRLSAPPDDSILIGQVVSVDGLVAKGRPDAQVVMIEYSDFECPFCAQFARETLPALVATYVEPGKASLRYAHFPLPRHTLAFTAAQAADCAADEGMFWPMHDRIFEAPGPALLTESALIDLASDIGLAPEAFARCLQDSTGDSVRQTMEEALALGISSTPTFLIGILRDDGDVEVTGVIRGALPLEQFMAVVDATLEKATAASDQPGLR